MKEMSRIDQASMLRGETENLVRLSFPELFSELNELINECIDKPFSATDPESQSQQLARLQTLKQIKEELRNFLIHLPKFGRRELLSIYIHNKLRTFERRLPEDLLQDANYSGIKFEQSFWQYASDKLQHLESHQDLFEKMAWQTGLLPIPYRFDESISLDRSIFENAVARTLEEIEKNQPQHAEMAEIKDKLSKSIKITAKIAEVKRQSQLARVTFANTLPPKTPVYWRIALEKMGSTKYSPPDAEGQVNPSLRVYTGQEIIKYREKQDSLLEFWDLLDWYYKCPDYQRLCEISPVADSFEQLNNLDPNVLEFLIGGCANDPKMQADKNQELRQTGEPVLSYLGRMPSNPDNNLDAVNARMYLNLVKYALKIMDVFITTSQYPEYQKAEFYRIQASVAAEIKQIVEHSILHSANGDFSLALDRFKEYITSSRSQFKPYLSMDYHSGISAAHKERVIRARMFNFLYQHPGFTRFKAKHQNLEN